MKTLLNQLLDSLRQRVLEDLSIIRQNEKEIRLILTEPLSNQRSHNLSNRYALSKTILQENLDNLKIQNLIVAFLHDRKDISEHKELLYSLRNFEKSLADGNQEGFDSIQSETVDDKKRSSSVADRNQAKREQTSDTLNLKSSDIDINQRELLFNLTISGKLAYGKVHPKFDDDNFFKRLLEHHSQLEEYEICGQLLKTRS